MVTQKNNFINIIRFATANLNVSAAAIFPVPEKKKNKMNWYTAAFCGCTQVYSLHSCSSKAQFPSCIVPESTQSLPVDSAEWLENRDWGLKKRFPAKRPEVSLSRAIKTLVNTTYRWLIVARYRNYLRDIIIRRSCVVRGESRIICHTCRRHGHCQMLSMFARLPWTEILTGLYNFSLFRVLMKIRLL